jgi:hypothetical protein
MALPFEQQMCNPFEAPSVPCALGILPVYAINATTASDIAAGVRFARKNNIRLVIKNTGHEYVSCCASAHFFFALRLYTHFWPPLTSIIALC